MTGEVARRYHEATKHSYESVHRPWAGLDRANWPNAFKEYVGLPFEPVPDSVERLLRLGAGVVRQSGRFHFRTYSSAGALYPVEVYVATPEALFHYHPREHALRRLRDADVRETLAEAAAAPELARAGAVVVLTGILWRTAWKYELRGYRHLWWDAGTMLANLLAVEPAGRVLTGFVDEAVNHVLGVDGRREVALALLAVGEADEAGPTTLGPLELEVEPLSPREREYPQADELHAASSLADPDAVRRYRAAARGTGGAPEPLTDELERVLRRRGSIREFALEPVPREELAWILARALDPLPLDCGSWNGVSLIANAVEGLDAGTYRFEPPDVFGLVRAGELRDLAEYLVLEQELGGRAAATSFLLVDLDAVLDALGDRGYQAAQLEAGVRAGRAQVAAFARDLGATASTFYDDDVSRALETSESPMLCFAVGRR